MFHRKFFYIPVDHFGDGRAKYYYPTLSRMEAVLDGIRQSPWGGFMDATAFVGDRHYTQHIVFQSRPYITISNLELKDMSGTREPSLAVLDEIAPGKHAVAIGSIFMVDILSQLAGSGELGNSVLHAIAAATRERTAYELTFGAPGTTPAVFEANTHSSIALEVPAVFPGFDRGKSDMGGLYALGFPFAAGTDGAMG